MTSRIGRRNIATTKASITLWLDYEPYQKLRELLRPKSISQEVNEHLKRRLAELEGREEEREEPQDPVYYESLKRQHEKLVKEKVRLEKELKKRKAFVPLGNFALKCGIKDDLSNIDGVVAKMVKEWTESKEDLHLFITLMEVAKQKMEAEQKLETIRTSTYS